MAGAKRERLKASKVPVMLFAVATPKAVAKAVDSGHLRGADGNSVALYERRRQAVAGVPSPHVILRVAARAAAEDGYPFYKGEGGRYETTKIPLSQISCSRLPRSIRGVTRIDAGNGGDFGWRGARRTWGG